MKLLDDPMRVAITTRIDTNNTPPPRRAECIAAQAERMRPLQAAGYMVKFGPTGTTMFRPFKANPKSWDGGL